MIIKSSSFLYLFDFDGTLVGSNQWKGILSSSFDCFRYFHFKNLLSLDIRWSILTGRPIIDKPFIKTVCRYHKIHPEKIFTQPTLFYHSKNDQEVYEFKENFIKSLLDEKVKNSFGRKIKKILYIDNDFDCTYYLNMKKENYSYLAISISDFIKRDFIQLLTWQEGDDE
jgi:phosphoglycolate phosphatase-like HAD superfamily hydrolase